MYPTTALIAATITTDRLHQAKRARSSRATRTERRPLQRHSRWRRAAALRWPRSPWWVIPTVVIGAAFLLVLVAGTGPAQAAFPGQNGKIAFSTLSDFEDLDVFVINPDGSGLVSLTGGSWAADSQPAFSPDGSRIAFTSDRTGNADIFVMNADGSDVTQVTSNPAPDADPAFSADGSRIAFTSDRDGNRDLYVIGVNGSGETRMTSSPANEEDPAFSADGSRLAFVSDRDGNREIYLAAADGSDPARLTADPAADYQPNFSPDGSRIAFTSTRADGLAHIHAMGADGSAPTPLSSGDTSSDEDPSFSPDGTQVAFAGDFVCPPGYGCGQILGGSMVVTASDGLSGSTGLAWAPWAELDWGVATPGSPPDPTPDPTPEPDTAPPETLFVSGPSGPTNDNSPSLSYSGTDDVTASGQLQYSTRLDQGAWSAYSSDTSVTLAVSDGPHTVSVRARDESGNEDPTPAQRSFTVDTVAPAGTVTIQGGAAQTRTLSVTLTLAAADPAPASVVTAMRISNTSGGLTSATWTAYTPTRQWTLSSGAGTKTVYVQYRDAAANPSAVAQDTIRYKP
jgi:dipeptidyl aminopeptidase/acylaminoacyl peptidase